MTVPTQIRIEENTKKEAAKLFASLGIDMSTAINMFLRQCIMRGGLPFAVEVPSYKKETLEAMEEGKRIAGDKSQKGFRSMKELNAALDEE